MFLGRQLLESSSEVEACDFILGPDEGLKNRAMRTSRAAQDGKLDSEHESASGDRRIGLTRQQVAIVSETLLRSSQMDGKAGALVTGQSVDFVDVVGVKAPQGIIQ